MNEKNLLVSVVIPAKDRHLFVESALNSVYGQILPKNVKLEVILVDNLSNPSLKSVLYDSFPDVRYFVNQKKNSPGGSRNIGLKYVRGSYVAFLDSDDSWRPEFINQSLEAILSSNAPATVCLTNPYFTGYFPIGHKIKLILLNLFKKVLLVLCFFAYGGKLPQSAFYLCQVSHMLFNKKNMKINFNENTKAAEDWEFVVNMSKSMSVEIVPKTLVNFRYETGSNTFTAEVRNAKENAYWKLLYSLPDSHRNGAFYYLFIAYIKLFLIR